MQSKWTMGPARDSRKTKMRKLTPGEASYLRRMANRALTHGTGETEPGSGRQPAGVHQNGDASERSDIPDR